MSIWETWETLSEDWEFQRCTRTAGATTDPEGDNDAIKITENTDINTTHHTVNNNIPSINPGDYLTFRVYAKAAERTKLWLRVQDRPTAAGSFNVRYDLSAGTAYLATTSGAGEISDYGIEPYQNGWYLCWMKGRVDTVSTGISPLAYILDAGGNVTYNGDGVSGLYLWMATLYDVWPKITSQWFWEYI